MLVWGFNILFLMLIAFAVRRYRVPGALAVWYWAGLAASVLGGILVGVYYTYTGGGDTFFYYQQAHILADYLRSDPLESVRVLLGHVPKLDGFAVENQPRSLFFVTLVALVQFATGGGYWVLVLYFSMFRFVASWYLFRVIAQRYPGANAAAAIAVLFFPSVVFWGSGLLKESVALAALFVLVGLFVQRQHTSPAHRVFRVFLFVFFAYLLVKLRYFYAAVFLPVFVAAKLAHWSVGRLPDRWQHSRWWYLVFFMLLGIFGYVASELHYNLRWQNLPAVLYGNYMQFAVESNPGSFIRYEHLRPDAASLLYNMPKACFSTLFRPNIWDYTHPLQIPLIIENFVLLCTATMLLLTRRTWHYLQRWEVVCALVFIVATAAMLGFASPNFGSLARYRIGLLSLAVLLLGLGVRYIYFSKPGK